MHEMVLGAAESMQPLVNMDIFGYSYDMVDFQNKTCGFQSEYGCFILFFIWANVIGVFAVAIALAIQFVIVFGLVAGMWISWQFCVEVTVNFFSKSKLRVLLLTVFISCMWSPKNDNSKKVMQALIMTSALVSASVYLLLDIEREDFKLFFHQSTSDYMSVVLVAELLRCCKEVDLL
jgi:hypothetical protein